MTKKKTFEEKSSTSYQADLTDKTDSSGKLEEKIETKANLKAKPHFTGHRERLRKRMSEQGHQSLADYELLEMILFRAFTRRDTKPLAKALLERFETLAGVLSAPTTLLKEVEGIGDRAIEELKLIQAAIERFSKSEIIDKPALDSWSKVINYCQVTMSYRQVEQFRILFLDKKNKLIKDEVQQEGTIDHTPVYPREIVKRGLELSATAIILVHNHPSGDPTPSTTDIQMTKTIIDVCEPLGINVHDHIIIGKQNHVSLRGLKLI